jgi:hypothetical protein
MKQAKRALLSQRIENKAKAIPPRKNDPLSLSVCVCVSAKAGTGGSWRCCVQYLHFSESAGYGLLCVQSSPPTMGER